MKERMRGAFQAQLGACRLDGEYEVVTTPPEAKAACEALGVKYVGDECAEEGLWLVALNQRDFKRAQTNERGIERKRKGFMIVIEYP
jgi:hypothetical protein